MNRSKIISIVLAGSIIVGGSTYAMASKKASRNGVNAKNKVVMDSLSKDQGNDESKSEKENGNKSEEVNNLIEENRDNIGTEEGTKVEGEATSVTENKKVQSNESKVSEDDLNMGLKYLHYSYGDIAAMSYNEKLEICKKNKDNIISIKKQADEDRKVNSVPPSEESQNNKLDIALREKGYPQSVINKLTEKEKEEFSKWEGNYRSHWGTLGWSEGRRESMESKVSEDDLNRGLRYLQYGYGHIAEMSYNEKLEICKENKDIIISVKKQADEDAKINSVPPSEESQNNKLDIALREKGYPQSVLNKLTEKEKEEFSKWEGNYRSHWGTLGWNESRREQQ